jgi:WD40 repeat protein
MPPRSTPAATKRTAAPTARPRGKSGDIIRQPQRKKSSGAAWVLGGLVLLLAAAGGFAFWAMNGGYGKSNGADDRSASADRKEADAGQKGKDEPKKDSPRDAPPTDGPKGNARRDDSRKDRPRDDAGERPGPAIDDPEIRELVVCPGHAGAIRSFSVAAGGKRALTVDEENDLRLWDVESGVKLFTIENKRGAAVLAVALLPDGKRALLGRADRSVALIDLEADSPTVLHNISGHTDAVRALDVTPDGRWLLSGGDDRCVRLTDLAGLDKSAASVLLGKALASPVESVRLDAAGKQAVSLGRDRAGLRWRLTDRGLGSAAGDEPLMALTLSRTGDLVLHGCADGSVVVESRGAKRRLQPLKDAVRALAVSPDGSYWAFASGGPNDKTLVVWDARGNREAKRVALAVLPHGLEFTADGQRLVVAGADGVLRVWGLHVPAARRPIPEPDPDARSGKISIRKLPTDEGPAGKVPSRLAASGDGRRALSAADGVVRVWSLNGRLKEIGKLDWADPRTPLLVVALSRDGKRAVIGSPGKVQAWDVDGNKLLSQLEGYTGGGYAIALSPDGRLGLAAEDKEVIVWDVGTGKALSRFKGHAADVSAAHFLPDGKRALTAGGETLCLWEVDGGKEVRRFSAPAPVLRMALGANGKRAASWDKDDMLRGWDVETGEELWKRIGSAPGLMALAPDGRFLAVSNPNKPLLQFLDPSTGEVIGMFEGDDWYIQRLTGVPDGKRLLGIGKNNALLLWEAAIDDKAR